MKSFDINAFAPITVAYRGNAPLVSVRKGGQIGLNPALLERIKGQPFEVTFYMQPGTRNVAMKLNSGGQRRIRVNKGQGSVSAKLFLDRAGIAYEKTRAYKPGIIEHNGDTYIVFQPQ